MGDFSGSLTSNSEEILNILTTFFTQLYKLDTSQNNFSNNLSAFVDSVSKISPNHKDLMTNPNIIQELMEAIKNLKNNKPQGVMVIQHNFTKTLVIC